MDSAYEMCISDWSSDVCSSDIPFSQGYICPKAYAIKELHHDPDVLKTPLIKRNGRFEQGSWEEALDYTAQRLKEIQAEHGADSVGFYIGNPTAHHPGLLLYSPILLEALGSRDRKSTRMNSSH